MGLIKAFAGAVGGELASQWLEAITADNMSGGTVMVKGSRLRAGDKRDSNRKGTSDVISNGSKIIVHPNQFMILMDNGRIIDYTAEPGGYTVDDSSAPSLFNGQFKDSLKSTFERFKFGGGTPYMQEVFFLNLQEIRDITFGTTSPVNYFDEFYNAELYLRANGFYTIKIEEPLKFFMEVIARDATHVEFADIKSTFNAEFLGALASTLNKMSADGFRVSHVASKTVEVSKYMRDCLDEDWLNTRGFAIQSVGFNTITYDEDSKKIISIRSEGAMLSDASIREGYVQGAVARGMEAAGSNEGGAVNAFMGMGMGMNAAGLGQMSAGNQQQIAQQQAAQQAAAPVAPTANGWKCACGVQSTGNFCTGCGAKKPEEAAGWTCPNCKVPCAGKFCPECGAKQAEGLSCPKCGISVDAGTKFCPECGEKL